MAKIHSYTPRGPQLFVTAELERVFQVAIRSGKLLSTAKNTLAFPPRDHDYKFGYLGFHYHPERDCMFAGSFYDIKQEVRKHEGYKTFRRIASSYLEQYFATTNHKTRAQSRVDIMKAFNSETNGGWFYYLSNKDRRMYRLTCDDLLRTPTHGGNPYLTKALKYMKNENEKQPTRLASRRALLFGTSGYLYSFFNTKLTL